MITKNVRVTCGPEDTEKVYSNIASVDTEYGRLRLFGADGGVIAGFSAGSWSSYEVLQQEEESGQQETGDFTLGGEVFDYQPGDVVVAGSGRSWVVVTPHTHWVYIGSGWSKYIRATGCSKIFPNWQVYRNGHRIR